MITRGVKKIPIVVLSAFFSLTLFSNADATEKDAPHITLLGDTPLIIPAGEPYTDPGVVAEDPQDGILSAVDTAEKFNTSNPGIYSVSYVAQDSDGNATFAHRIVIVKKPKEYYGEPISIKRTSRASIDVRYENGEFKTLNIPMKNPKNVARFKITKKNTIKCLSKSRRTRYILHPYTGEKIASSRIKT